MHELLREYLAHRFGADVYIVKGFYPPNNGSADLLVEFNKNETDYREIINVWDVLAFVFRELDISRDKLADVIYDRT